MKYLIIGLGNIGTEYQHTRHNIGFDVVDKLTKELNGDFKTEKLANISYLKYKSRNLVVIKPSTYMNLSGKAVNYWMQKEKISTENILVITDDLSLPLGKIRLRPKGSDGGHNGLKNIQLVLNTSNYSRLRFGIGNDFQKGKQVSHVLGPWKEEEIEVLSSKIEIAVECIKSFCTVGVSMAMTNWNNK